MLRNLSLFILAAALALPANAQFGKVLKGLGDRGAPTDSKSASGLKEALQIGTDHTVDLTGTTDGFLKNEAIKILLPEKLQTAQRGLRMAGMGPKLDEFELSMNRAAEKAAPAARSIFKDALMQMTFDDARKILTGGDTAATEYFKGKTSDSLTASFRPTVESAMEETGVVQQYKQLAGGVQSLPFGRSQSFDITDYVVAKTLDGLFHVLGEEEKKIRTDPAAQITPLLKEVFGKR
ncbi:MAG: DUF4197 domain-containing protein [Acidobacteria bacterium]|nr:DUF4197 domain-containing protein [Acidobacteriota bacterium]MDA1233465.1 DUF4197 domain-containing protein [Acidobacteriota bacterium]